MAVAFSADPAPMQFGAYYANWAQYRIKPYTFPASALTDLAPMLDRLMYGFVYFCPPAGTDPMPYWAVDPFGNCTDDTEYQLMFVEPKDEEFIEEINDMKKDNPNMKHVMSVGGWNFPSGFWSKMSSTADSRAKFMKSLTDFVTKYKFDGVDIDWEFPTSGKRTDQVKITCDKFRVVEDPGGTPADTDNIVALFHDMRAALPQTSLSFASPANCDNAKLSNIGKLADYLDYFHIMAYDYTVSDVEGGSMFSPNAPLYNPPQPAVQMSIDYSVQCYLNAGIKPSQLQLGVAYYGHTWWNDELTEEQWQQFGGQPGGKVQQSCCGPFKNTYGGGFGKGSQQCGSLMYSEIVAAGFETIFDNVTMSNIGYLNKDSGDGSTKKGTWLTFNDKDSLFNITKYAMEQSLAGVFTWDATMDTVDYDAAKPTFELSKMIVKTMGGGGSGNICDPSDPAGCNVCDQCCKSYLKDPTSCDQCVTSECTSA
jgi:chitinase